MKEKGLLLKRVYGVDYNATNCVNYLKDLVGVNVTHVEYLEQSSSAGDWSGFFIQKYNRRSYVILFSQENNWPNRGFTLYTGEKPFWDIPGDFNRNTLEEVRMLICGEYYS